MVNFIIEMWGGIRMKNYRKLRTYNKKEIEELIKRAFAIESQIAMDTEELRIRFRMELAGIPVEISEVEVLREECK